MNGIGSDMLATLAVGGGVAAVLFAAMHTIRKLGYAPPRWLLPASIGIAMIAFASWNEYSWADRIKSQLPTRASVIAEGQDRSALRPWTFIVAPTTRLAVIDRATLRDDGRGGQVAGVILVERWKRSVTVEQGIDCKTGKVRPPNAGWQDAGSDPAYALLCGG